MNDQLSKYVDELFIPYKSQHLQDFKEEIKSNLEAKMQDLLNQGINEEDALNITKNSIPNIDALIEPNRLIYIDQFHLECLQNVLIKLLIAWILTIPPIVIYRVYPLNILLIMMSITVGMIYYHKSKNVCFTIRFINIKIYQRRKKIAWILWGIFYLLYALTMTVVFFGSNIWFHRTIHIDGPYQFFNMVIRYYVPLISILIPILIGSFLKVLPKHEARDDI